MTRPRIAFIFPSARSSALQLQAGLDGFLAIEKYLMVRRGLFTTDRRREPNAWSLDAETQAEVDRLMELLGGALASLKADDASERRRAP